MPKVAKKPAITLNHVEQAVNSTVLTFITDCGKAIEVQEQSILDYIDATEINHSQECDGAYWDPSSITTECVKDAKEYLEANFESVTQMYFDQVVLLTMKEAFHFMQGYASSLVKQDKPIDNKAINLMLTHVQNEYGIRMEVA